MELFVVLNTSNEVCGRFGNKKEAKDLRNELQSKTASGLPKPEHRSIASAWSYRVSTGADHRANK